MALIGLVLHTSRCGSTALLRALEAWPGVVGVNEPPELDDALAVARRTGDEMALLAVLDELGGHGERVVVKADSWHVLEAERLVSRAGVPWVFVHRDPEEVVVSHLRSPGSQVVPGLLDPVWFGEPETVLFHEHVHTVLAAICTAAAEQVVTSTLVDHAEHEQEVYRVAALFGLHRDEVDEELLGLRRATHAKSGHPYADDRADKQAALTPELREAVAARVRPAYDALLAAGGRAAP